MIVEHRSAEDRAFDGSQKEGAEAAPRHAPAPAPYADTGPPAPHPSSQTPHQPFLEPVMRALLDLTDARGTHAEHLSDLLEVKLLDIV